MDNGYKIWHCAYRWFGHMGAWEEIDIVVIAERKDKAIGMAVQSYPTTNPPDWDATEIDGTKEGVHHINEHSH